MLFAVLASIGYALACVLQALKLFRKTAINRQIIVTLSAVSVALHGLAVYHAMFTETGIDLGFYHVASLVAFFFGALLVGSAMGKPLDNLFFVLFPISILTLLFSAFLASPYTPRAFSAGIIVHILVSILAYSILTISAAHAVLLIVQDKRLKAHHPGGMMWGLPPLQTMERLLFEILVVGVVMLTLAIVTGLLFVSDMFAQHLLHKTVLTIVAWIIYGILLWGHFLKGWRGSSAAKWTLSAFAVLVLAFFGSKFVLELVLDMQ